MCILYNQRDATYTVFFIIISALHVSGGFSAHRQELIKLYVQPWVLSCFPAAYRWCGWVGSVVVAWPCLPKICWTKWSVLITRAYTHRATTVGIEFNFLQNNKFESCWRWTPSDFEFDGARDLLFSSSAAPFGLCQPERRSHQPCVTWLSL